MGENALKYLEKYKDQFSKEVLVEQLRKADYSEEVIVESIRKVYGKSESRKESNFRFAGFWKRLGAYFVDALVLNFIGLLSIIFARYYSMELKQFFLVGAIILLNLAYSIFMLGKFQATLGKKLFGLKVVREDFDKASIGQIILREIPGKILSGILASIGYVMAAFTEKKQAFHDFVAGTVVVEAGENEQ